MAPIADEHFNLDHWIYKILLTGQIYGVLSQPIVLKMSYWMSKHMFEEHTQIKHKTVSKVNRSNSNFKNPLIRLLFIIKYQLTTQKLAQVITY